MIKSNFTAELHCKYGQVVIADTSILTPFIVSNDQDGWLSTEQSGGDFKRVAFSFEFLRSDATRSYYKISCDQHWDYSGSRLGRNNNGWLGLYGTHIVGRIIDTVNPVTLLSQPDHWKIETLQPWDGDPASAESIPFYLRDSFGHRVAHSTPSQGTFTMVNKPFLNASSLPGEVLEFKFRNIQLA